MYIYISLENLYVDYWLKSLYTCKMGRVVCINPDTPFSSKNALKFSFFPWTSREWNQLPAEVVLSPSLAVFKEKAIQTRQVNDMYVCILLLLLLLLLLLYIYFFKKVFFLNS